MTSVHLHLHTAIENFLAEKRAGKAGVKSFTMKGDTQHFDRLWNKIKSARRPRG